MKLENFAVVYTGSPYTAPELQQPHLHGTVYGHPSFNDGEVITTSRIVGKKVIWL